MANLGRRSHPSKKLQIAKHCKQKQQQCAQLATGRAAPGSSPHTPGASRAAASRGRRTSETPLGGPKRPIKRPKKLCKGKLQQGNAQAVKRPYLATQLVAELADPPFAVSRRALAAAPGALWRLFGPKLRPEGPKVGNAGPKIKSLIGEQMTPGHAQKL